MASTHDLKVQDIFSVKDYVCLVTGGGTGIGLMATQALAANGSSSLIAQEPRTHYEQELKYTSPADDWKSLKMLPNLTL